MKVFEMLKENEKTQNINDFDLIFARYFNRLVYFIRRSINGDIDEAQNIAQETFIVLLEKSPKLNFDSEKSAVSYIFQIARNLIQNHNRKSGFRKFIERVVYFFEAETRTHEKYGEVETMTDFDAALAMIPETYKEVIMMKYIMEMSTESIAEVLNISEGTVKSRMFNGSIQMAKHLKGYSNFKDSAGKLKKRD